MTKLKARYFNLLALFLVLALSGFHTGPADAGFISGIAKLAKVGKAGKAGTAAKLGAGGILAGDAAGLIKVLPDAPDVTRIAAISGPDGIRLSGKGDVDFGIYKSSEDLTSRLDELGVQNSGQPVEIYVDDYSYARHRDVLDPVIASNAAQVKILINKRSVVDVLDGGRLVRFDNGLKVVNAATTDLRAVNYRLLAPMPARQTRLLSLGGDGTELPKIAAREYGSRASQVVAETINAKDLASQLKAARGQTVIVTGRIDGSALQYRSGTAEGSLSLDDLKAASAEADVNLVVVDTGIARQPGPGFWDAKPYARLKDALAEHTHGGFLAKLAPEGQNFVLEGSPLTNTHFAISARPQAPRGASATRSGSLLNDSLIALDAAQMVGRIAIYARNEEAEQEWKGRFFSKKLTANQNILIMLNLVFGTLTIGMFWRLARSIWKLILPAQINRWIVRLLTACLTVLMIPVFGAIIGVPYLLWTIAVSVWNILTWPFRLIFRKLAPA